MTQQELLIQVREAKTDMEAADQLIRDYMPFIKSETAKFINRSPILGQDDELSIAMIAFHEAIQRYDEDKGAFISLAQMLIKNRLIDYWRKNKKHQQVISLESKRSSADESQTLMDTLDDGQNFEEDQIQKRATQAEIEELSQQLHEFGVSLEDIADNSPKQERTLEACQDVVNAVKAHPKVMERFLETKRLPMKKLVEISKVNRKTIERHRKYLVALLLIYSNGYEIIRGHLARIRR